MAVQTGNLGGSLMSMHPMTPHVLIWLLSVPVIALLHEAGHALAAGPAGFRVTSFGIGHGKPLLRWRTSGGTIIYVGRWLFTGGLCVAIPVDPVPSRRWLYHSGGLLVQAALAPLLWWGAQHIPVLEYVHAFNLVVIAWNLLPLRAGGYATDGWQMLAGAAVGGPASQFFTHRKQVERVLHFEQQVGSPLGVAWCRLVLRWMDVVLGLDDDDWEPDDVLLLAEPQFEALHAYVKAERHRLEGRSLAGLAVIHQLRRAYGAQLPSSAADMLSISEARCYLAQEEPRLARDALARVAGVGGVIGHSAAAVSLEAALSDGDPDVVIAAARRVSERLAGSFLDAPSVARALHEAAETMQEAGRLDAAEALYGRARFAARQVIGAATARDRIPVARRMGEVAGVEIRQDRAL